MKKEEQTIQETTAAATNSPDDPSVTTQEQSIDTQTASETDTATEHSDANAGPDEKDDDSQASPESDATTTTQPLTPEAEPVLNALAEINQRLAALQELFEKQNAHDHESPPLQRESAQMDQRLAELHELFNNQIARNQNQKQMFDTIYREMKDYKENSLMEAFHKPIIHNLIQFYDNFASVESQLDDISGTIDAFGSLFDEETAAKQLRKLRPKELAEELREVWNELKARLSDFRNNMENVRIELEEVLYRIDVEPYAEHLDKLDRKLHKTIKTIPTEDPDQNENVAAVHKTGFSWREKVFRPEEVTILRYTPPAGEETVGENPTQKKGDETDG